MVLTDNCLPVLVVYLKMTQPPQKETKGLCWHANGQGTSWAIRHLFGFPSSGTTGQAFALPGHLTYLLRRVTNERLKETRDHPYCEATDTRMQVTPMIFRPIAEDFEEMGKFRRGQGTKHRCGQVSHLSTRKKVAGTLKLHGSRKAAAAPCSVSTAITARAADSIAKTHRTRPTNTYPPRCALRPAPTACLGVRRARGRRISLHEPFFLHCPSQGSHPI